MTTGSCTVINNTGVIEHGIEEVGLPRYWVRCSGMANAAILGSNNVICVYTDRTAVIVKPVMTGSTVIDDAIVGKIDGQKRRIVMAKATILSSRYVVNTRRFAECRQEIVIMATLTTTGQVRVLIGHEQRCCREITGIGTCVTYTAIIDGGYVGIRFAR